MRARVFEREHATRTTMAEFLREPIGVVGSELRVGLVMNSSELRLSEPSLRPLLMELLSSQLEERKGWSGVVDIFVSLSHS